MHKTLLEVDDNIHIYIKKIELENPQDHYKVSQLAINYIASIIRELKGKFEVNAFLDVADEIFYFKNLKAHLLALKTYYTLIQRIEIEKPTAPKKKLKDYYLKALFDVKQKLSEHDFFYKYYVGNRNEFDACFFTRLNNLDTASVDLDKMDSPNETLLIFSEIEAYCIFRQYLKTRIKQLDKQYDTIESLPKKSNLQWTISKTDLIELIYALHAAGAFNNGKADIKEIAEHFQLVFNIELGQYNRVFYDIRSRKTNKVKFLDAVKEALIKRIKDTDNELFI